MAYLAGQLVAVGVCGCSITLSSQARSMNRRRLVCFVRLGCYSKEGVSRCMGIFG